MFATEFYYATVYASLLLFSRQSWGQTILLEHEAGTDVSFTFNFTYSFGLLQLKRNNSEIYRNDGRRPRLETRTSISFSESDPVKFTLNQVEIADSGIYKCFVIGQEKLPAYNVRVISSEKFIGISGNFNNWDPYELNESVAAIEGTVFQLACRVEGGLRSDCFISWRIETEWLTIHETNITDCDKYHEESLFQIKVVTENLDGGRITCQSGELNTAVFVRTKRKPVILNQHNEYTEGSQYNVSCVLNGTSDYPAFHWSLDNDNITKNATQQRNEITEVYFRWESVLTLFPSRQHFSKLLRCMISSDEDRSNSVKLKVEFAATITEIFASPSRFVDVHEPVNITCVVMGFPQLKIFWLKGCGSTDCFVVLHEPVYHYLSETTSVSTLVLMHVNKSDGGSYKCRAFNGVGQFAEEGITIHVEEQGILLKDSTIFAENQPVNITCQVKMKEPLTFIRWTLDHKVDVTTNATQYEVQNQRGETVLRSILTFYPKRDLNSSDLTCQWDSGQRSSDTMTVTILDAVEKPLFWTFPFTPNSWIYFTIGIPLGLLFIALSIIFFLWSKRKRKARGGVTNPKCSDKTGLTLGLINAGSQPPAGRDSYSLYEDMTSYTTDVITSDFPVNTLREVHQQSTDELSCENGENESRMETTVVANCRSSLGDKLWTLFGQEFGIQTKEKGNRLSKHFTIEDDSGIMEHEDESQLQTCNIKDNDDYHDISLSLTIYNKLAQRGSIFFCAATVARKNCSMNVTVKVLSEFSNCSEKDLFKKEMRIVKDLDSHPNIAEVLGICCSSQPNCIILEKLSDETLKEVLIQQDANDEPSGVTENLRRYAEQVCSAMAFLSKNEYYHPDLRCEKVIVDKQRICKLYDFVPEEIFSAQNDESQQVRRRSGLVAPEILEGKQHNCRTEVWEFGLLLWEIYSYGLNHNKDAEETNRYSHFIGLDCLKKPQSFPQDMYIVMLKCRCNHPPDRPSFSALLDDIRRMSYTPTV